MYCKNCGKEIDNQAVFCPECGVATKPAKRSIFKRWWFWVIIGFVSTIIVIGSSGSDVSNSNNSENKTVITTTKQTYKKVELRKMVDDLNNNALKAEKTYQDKYIKFSARISGFDSDGGYISVKPVNADAWDFTSVTCDIENDEQSNFLLEKSKGDIITIKGKVTSVGEFLGYNIRIDEIFD